MKEGYNYCDYSHISCTVKLQRVSYYPNINICLSSFLIIIPTCYEFLRVSLSIHILRLFAIRYWCHDLVNSISTYKETLFCYPSYQLEPVIYDTSYTRNSQLFKARDKGGDENRAQGILGFIRSHRRFTPDSTY